MEELLSDAGLSSGGGNSHSGSGSRSSTGGVNSDVSTQIQQATQQLHQLQTVTQASADSITANTDALTQDKQNQSSSTGGVSGTIGSAADSLLSGGGLLGGLLGGGLTSLFSGIASLFGGGSSQPAPLVQYRAPEAQNFQEAVGGGLTGDAVYDANGQPRVSGFTELALSGLQSGGASGASSGSSAGGQQSSQQTQQVTVQVNAMDSQSFMDRSADIANAVRSAMLNMHSINDVVNDL